MSQFNLFLPIIESIATGTPNNLVQQADAAEFVACLQSLERHQHRIEKIYKNTRIENRHLAIQLLTNETVTFCQQQSNIEKRMQLYEQYAVPLAEKVARKAISKAAERIEKADPFFDSENLKDSIGLIVFVTSTGFLAPGIDAKLIDNLGLRRNIARVPINFMGCAAAMNGLRVACDHVRTHPNHKALAICLELSSVNAVFEGNLNDVIIHSIFGDGCAAVVLGACQEDKLSDHNQVIIRDNFSYLTENTEDGIRLAVRNNGITCQLSPQLPSYIESEIAPIITNFLASHNLTQNCIDLWAVHPGGTRIIEKVQLSLGLRDEQLVDSWDILREYGNMLSCAVLFVMERMLFGAENNSGDSSQRNTLLDKCHNDPQKSSERSKPLIGIAFSFSPGVGLEGLLFEKN